jgi:hypothetical protein
MLLWTIRTTIISIILIFLVHHLIVFFTKTLTVPKIKDLVNAPTHKYENIYNSMNPSAQQTPSYSSNTSNINDLPNPTTMSNKDYDNLLPISITNNKPEVSAMKNELKNFLKKQLKGGGGGGVGFGVPATMDY